MDHPIGRVAVIGAGVMGAGIAAHLANAGFPVLLLDIAPSSLDAKEEAKGLGLEHPAVRNRIVRQGFERAVKMKPPAFMGQAAQRRVQLGNLEDDFDALSEVDWIIEVVVERLDIKRQLMARIDAIRAPQTLVTTNTSGLPISDISEGLSEGFKSHFFGTHFFNPPRYMKLVEIIRGSEADALKVSSLAELIVRRLGKGVVFCKDTPNFIANRIMAVHGSFCMEYALANGYRFEEADAVTGPLIGRPKTATFRLQDLVGIDVAAHVASNLYHAIPKDPYTEVLQAPNISRVLEGLLERGRLGKKSGGEGFYRKVKGPKGPAFEVLNPETFDYEPQQKVELPSLAAVQDVEDLGERLSLLFAPEWQGDRAADYAWAVIGHFLGYAADVAQEVAYDLASIDKAVRWGFGYDVGPFELWDLLGVEAVAERLEASGIEVAEWVKEMLFAEVDSFYRVEYGWVTGYYDWRQRGYVDLLYGEHHIEVEHLRKTNPPLESNASASLHDLSDGVLLLEFHSKMNAIDDDLVAMLRLAAETLEDDAFYGLVIGNDGKNFSVGANLAKAVESLSDGGVEALEGAVKALQDVLLDLRHGPKPVVAAVHGMALGGGLEIALGVDRIVAHAESYLGLVEAGVGLLPAGGGLRELVRRVISPLMLSPTADPLPAAQRLLETVAMAKVSGSAEEGRELGFLGERDRIVMQRDELLYEAKQEVLAMASEGYMAPESAQLYAGGRDLLAALEVAVWSLEQAGYASEHDALVARKVAFVLAGGDMTHPGWVDESHFLALERQAFLELIQTPKTQARIEHMLTTGKPLRN